MTLATLFTRHGRSGAIGLLVVAALVGAPGGVDARPGAAPGPFKGTIGPGEKRSFDLPEASKRFWDLSLAGADGVDLDLRVACGERRWASRGENAFEELLVPADKGLQAVVEHYGGGQSEFELTATPVVPGKKVALGKPVEGQADAEAARFQVHELPITGTKFTSLDLSGPEGADFDLYLYDAQWKLIQSSTGDEADESLILSPARAARWAVVKAWQGAGAYTLTCDAVGEEARRLDPAAPVKGNVGQGETTYFRMRTTKSGVVTVHLDGPARGDLDLFVYGPDGYTRQSIAADASEEIAINGAKRGDYLVAVRPGDDTSSGEFTLSTEGLELSRLAPSGGGGSHVWGLFVGIAAYEDVNALTYTPKDALSVYQALRAQGQVDARHSIVLLDELARRADVVSALETIAARADADDTFVFFYSGHGGNDAKDGARGDPKDERDGGDEFLVCQDSNGSNNDGDLIDDDLKALLDKIPCQKQLLLFDSCFSGGMAEVIDRDGRYGLFSSLETQTSNEATNLKAGLLTAILVRAFGGEADEDKDGKVTAAELSAFVTRVQPNTCASCQAALTPQMDHCPECGEALKGDNARQIPVIASRLEPGFVLTEPAKHRRAVVGGNRRR